MWTVGSDLFEALACGNSAASNGLASKPPKWELPDSIVDPDIAWERLRIQSGRKVESVVPSNAESKKPPGTLRVVCISDTHGMIGRMPSIPDGDVLVHAGDFTSTGMKGQVKEFASQLASMPHRHKIVIAGNHDLTFEPDTYPKTRQTIGFHAKDQDCAECIQMVSDVCHYLQDSAVTIEGVKFYGSPWSPSFYNWAFNADRGDEISAIWDKIPEDTEVLITHGPPVGYGDLCTSKNRAGCVDLLRHVETRIRPRLHIFGHIHEGYGVISNGDQIFANASTCTYMNTPSNPPLVFDIPLRKTE